MYIFLLNFTAHAYPARKRYNNACLLEFSLRFSTKYRFVLRNFRLCSIAVIRWCIVSRTVAIQKIVFFFQGGDIGSELTVEIMVVYHISQPTIGSLGKHRRLRQRGAGRSPSWKQCLDFLYAILCDSGRVLVHFGSWLSVIITQNHAKKYNWGWKSHVACWHL